MTSRPDVVIGICHDCSRRTLLSALSRTCAKCWEKALAADEAKVKKMEEAMADG